MSKEITLRRALVNDLDFLFELANDPTVRAQSFSPDSINRPEHEAWFQEKLKDNNCVFWIAELAGKPIGQLRFQIRRGGDSAEVSISLIASERGKGFGKKALKLGIEATRKEKPVAKIFARSKAKNTASHRLFLSVGFKEEQSQVQDNVILFTQEINLPPLLLYKIQESF
jgi:UDP-2,4-diacetamido-2,4,6-trideoxy-beta-L-altropyranose hydrolase